MRVKSKKLLGVAAAGYVIGTPRGRELFGNIRASVKGNLGATHDGGATGQKSIGEVGDVEGASSGGRAPSTSPIDAGALRTATVSAGATKHPGPQADAGPDADAESATPTAGF